MPRLRAVVDTTALDVHLDELAGELARALKASFRDGAIAGLESLRDGISEGLEPGVFALTVDQVESLIERALDAVRTVALS